MKRLIAGMFLLALAAGCESEVTEPTTPTDLFTTESKPYGDPSLDPYRPYGPKPLVNIPAEPQPSQTKRPQK